MKINNFNDLYLAELQELVSVERQFAQSLRSMAAGQLGLRDDEHVLNLFAMCEVNPDAVAA